MKTFVILLLLLLPGLGHAGRSFNGASDFISATDNVTSASPLTICAWVNVTNLTTFNVITGMFTDGSNDHNVYIDATGTAGGDPARLVTRSTSTATATVSPYVAGSLSLICGVNAAANSHIAYVNGSPGAENTTSITPNDGDTTAIGVRIDAADDGFFLGTIYQVAYWNRALSTDEIASLWSGRYSLDCYRRQIVNFTDLIRDIKDQALALAWSATGTTVVDHERITYCH